MSLNLENLKSRPFSSVSPAILVFGSLLKAFGGYREPEKEIPEAANRYFPQVILGELMMDCSYSFGRAQK